MLLFGPKNNVISKKNKTKKRSSPKFQQFFRPKTRDLQKIGLLRIFNGFSGRKQVISKKEVFSKIYRFFRPKTRDLQKKKVLSEITTVLPAEIKGSPKQIKLFARDFDGPFTSQCHLDGPPKLHGPRVHCPPCPPLSWALGVSCSKAVTLLL